MSDLLLMSQPELTRLELMARVTQKRLTQRQAATLLHLSTRHIKRLCRAYREHGAAALQSKRRTRPSNHRLPASLTSRAVELRHPTYYDFGPTLAQQKLWEADGLRLSVESVRQLLIAEGLWQVRRARKPVVHQLRERRPCCGELIQIDGSPHHWFEHRAEKCTLLVMVDDATSRLMPLQFVAAETTFNYFAAVKAYLTQHGKPRAFYSDKFSVFRVTLPNALSGTGLTQFGRAMKELDIELICAHSPQAKGRVERANQTLQDRLTKELRLRSISSIREANAYLPEFIQDYNSRFACTPRSSLDGHRPLHAAENLDRILMLVEHRVLSKNLTLSYGKVIYQIRSKRPADTMRRARVEVREASTGEVRIEYKGKALDYSIYAKQERPAVTPTKFIDAEVSRPTTTAKHQYGPVAQTHPWKR